MTTFDFSQEEAWETSTSTILPPGNHICFIHEQEGPNADPLESESSGGHPQIAMKLVKGEYDIRDWVVITRNSMGKALQLFEAAGLGNPGDMSIPSPEWSAFVAKLKGKKVGVIVRQQRDERPEAKPNAMVTRVQGYCTPAEIGQSESDAPADTAGMASSNSSSQQDDDIPF